MRGLPSPNRIDPRDITHIRLFTFSADNGSPWHSVKGKSLGPRTGINKKISIRRQKVDSVKSISTLPRKGPQGIPKFNGSKTSWLDQKLSEGQDVWNGNLEYKSLPWKAWTQNLGPRNSGQIRKFLKE